MTQPLNIGVLGSGPAGRTLATGFLGHRHPVMIASRDRSKLQDWLRHTRPQARVGTFAETAEFGDLVVLSVNGRAAEDVIRLAGIENLNGKIVLDASDPLDFSSGRPGLFVGTTDSPGERIQRLIPDARVASRARAGWQPSVSPGLSTPTGPTTPSSESVSEDAGVCSPINPRMV
jgi:8-hydroxy-5-deazaflavin:NADPH oxidoreductase